MAVRMSNGRQWSDHQPQNTYKLDNLASTPLGDTGVVSTFVLLSQIRLVVLVSRPGTALWDPMTLPDDILLPPDRHGPPIPPVSASVGGVCDQDQLTHLWALQGYVGLVPNHQQIWECPVEGGTLRQGSPWLPGAYRLRSQTYPWVFRDYAPGCQLGWNSSPPALVLLHSGRRSINLQADLPLPGGYSRVNTPPPVEDILVESFAVWRAFHAVTWTNYFRHLGEVPPLNWHSIPS